MIFGALCRAAPSCKNWNKMMFSGEIASLELKSMGGYRLLVNETGIHPQEGFILMSMLTGWFRYQLPVVVAILETGSRIKPK